VPLGLYGFPKPISLSSETKSHMKTHLQSLNETFLFADQQQSSSLVETMLCYVAPKPLDCVKEQAGRMLNYWDAKVEESRHKLMSK